MSLKKLLVFFAQFWVPAVLAASRPPSVALDYGTFIGLRNDTTKITSYRGVRFADAPIGELRWREPVSPPSGHLGTVNATKFGPKCISTKSTRLNQGSSEDCLYGNIYVPSSATPESELPVMVWFHGGGYEGGDSQDDPTMILQTTAEPLIFVSFEYRLGQFGFLPGSAVKNDGVINAGLHDQRAALRWVQTYIGKFGGNPQSVTIWGQSAGSGSTMLHLIWNGGDNEDLFAAAMGDSPPVAYMPAWNDPYLEGIFNQIASLSGCNPNSTNVMSCLRSANLTSLITAGSSMLATRTSTLYPFAPFIDGDNLQDRPVEAYLNGKFAKVPVFFGSNTNEGSHWSAELPNPNANTSMPNATEDTVYNFLQGQYAGLSRPSFDQALELYPLADYNNSFSLQGQQMYGEIRYICPAGMITGVVSDQGLKAFQYRYSNPHLGDNHKDELDAMWDTPSSASANDLALFRQMRGYWTSFVTSGEPVSKSGVVWNEVSSGPDSDGNPRILLDPSGVKMESISPEQIERCQFWRSISEELQI